MSTYHVRVMDRNIISLVQTGELGGFARDTAKRVESVGRAIAPKRTGRLAGSHVTLPTIGSNQYHSVYRVSALAPYSAYVHEGTGIYGDYGRPIVSARGMKLPGRNPNPARTQGRSEATVIFYSKGQRAQPWLAEAARIVGGSI